MDDITTNTNPSTPMFATPDAGSLDSGRFEAPPEIEYAAMKTADLVLKSVDKEVFKNMVAEARATQKLGFHYYDRELETPARMSIDKFSFVVLATFSKISGYRETQPGQPGIKYYSSYVKNSKFEQFALWEMGIKRPIAKGFYKGKKGDNDFAKLVKFPTTQENDLLNGQPENFTKVPDGAGFHQHFFIYWIEGDRVMDLKLRTMVSREVKEGVSRAEARAGRRVKADNVKLFSLADGALWGFSVTRFRKVTKDGADYPVIPKGEMFLVPEFECGVVKQTGEGANPELFDKCMSFKEQINADYEREVERRKKFGAEGGMSENNEAVVAPPMPLDDDANFPVEQTGGGIDFAKRTSQPPADPFPAYHEQTPPPANFDDLPF